MAVDVHEDMTVHWLKHEGWQKKKKFNKIIKIRGRRGKVFLCYASLTQKQNAKN